MRLGDGEARLPLDPRDPAAKAERERRERFLANLTTQEREDILSEEAERSLGVHRVSAAVRGTERHSARLVRLTWVLIVLTAVLSILTAILVYRVAYP